MADTIFSGSSRFANDFQQVIDRAVAIASLPLRQLNDQKTEMSAQSAALSELETKFTALQTALDHLNELVSGGTFRTALTDETVLRASVGAGALPGTYTVDVLDPGTYSTTLSPDGLQIVTDPFSESISNAASFTLTVNGVPTIITPATGSLTALAAAINTSGAGVEASIINIGAPGSPDYRLVLRSSSLGDVTLQLNDGAQDLLTSLSTGTLATYRVNGQPATPISSDTRSVIIAPGISVELLKAGSTSITAERDVTEVGNALAAFTTAFNAAVDAVDAHRGENAGILRGQSFLYSLASSLRDMADFDGAGTVASLEDLGVTFDRTGKLSVNQTTFAAAALQFDNVQSFLGATTTGGFLKSATDILRGLEDSTSGILPLAIQSLTSRITQQDRLITASAERVELMRQTLTAKIAAADVLISNLEQQVFFIKGLFESQRNYQRDN